MKKTLFLGLVSILLFGCSSPRKSFENGDYEKAYNQSLKKAKNYNASNQDKEILLESLRKIVATNMEKIGILEQSDDPKELKKTLKLIKKTQHKITEAKKYGNIKFEESHLALNEKTSQISKELFDLYFDSGFLSLNKGEETNNKFLIQQAYSDFRNANKFGNHGTLDSLQKVALELGVVNINVNTIGGNADVGWIFRQITRKSNTFQKVTYRGSASGVDCTITVNFGNLNVVLENNIVMQKNYNKEVVVGHKTVSDSTGTRYIPIYNKVYGSVTVRKLKKIARGRASVHVSARTSNCRKSGTSFNREKIAEVKEITISGDQRAIPTKYGSQYSKSINDLPRDNEMLKNIIKQIYSDFERQF